MILTCPECATGYFVDDAQIKPGGRTVRCAACGARWTAQRDAPLDLVSTPEEGAFGREPGAPEAAPAPLTGDDLPKVFRERASNQQKMRAAAVTGLVWGGLAVALVLIVGALILFRESVARAIPSTAAAYGAIGLPVNRIGLTIEGVHAEPALQDGHAALSVAMTVRNVTDRAVVSPPLSIVLLNAQGKRIGGQIVRPANPRIPPGEQRFFATAILDPPLTAHDLEVSFALDAVGRIPVAKAIRSAATAAAAAPALRGAA
ncbi:MAG TPA: MJ0042-type zinc finger domain-containing protein, partial [Caulobacteraceae bacterium]